MRLKQSAHQPEHLRVSMNITIKEWILVAIILLAGIVYIAKAEQSVSAPAQHTGDVIFEQNE